MKKVTAQQFFDAYKETLAESLPERRKIFRELPEQWEDLCEEDKALFRLMAWKLNLIAAEFEK